MPQPAPEISLVPISESSLPPALRSQRQVVVSTAPDTNIENPNARLESDRNNIAASQLDPTQKDSPLPELGKGQRSILQDSGKPGDHVSNTPPQPKSPQAQPRPPQPQTNPASTSPTTPEKPTAGDLPLYRTNPQSTDPTTKPDNNTPANPSKLTPPPSNVGFGKVRTAGEGGRVQTGLPSPEATATALGKYKARMFNAIGSRWYLKVEELMQTLQVSTIRIRFTVTADGVIKDLTVLNKTDRAQALETVSVSSIRDAGPLPPFPAKLKQEIGDSFEEEVSFGIY
jgi:hypothetical protein